MCGATVLPRNPWKGPQRRPPHLICPVFGGYLAQLRRVGCSLWFLVTCRRRAALPQPARQPARRAAAAPLALPPQHRHRGGRPRCSHARSPATSAAAPRRCRSTRSRRSASWAGSRTVRLAIDQSRAMSKRRAPAVSFRPGSMCPALAALSLKIDCCKADSFEPMTHPVGRVVPLTSRGAVFHRRQRCALRRFKRPPKGQDRNGQRHFHERVTGDERSMGIISMPWGWSESHQGVERIAPEGGANRPSAGSVFPDSRAFPDWCCLEFCTGFAMSAPQEPSRELGRHWLTPCLPYDTGL